LPPRAAISLSLAKKKKQSTSSLESSVKRQTRVLEQLEPHEQVSVEETPIAQQEQVTKGQPLVQQKQAIQQQQEAQEQVLAEETPIAQHEQVPKDQPSAQQRQPIQPQHVPQHQSSVRQQPLQQQKSLVEEGSSSQELPTGRKKRRRLRPNQSTIDESGMSPVLHGYSAKYFVD
jgi:hypothetical protein